MPLDDIRKTTDQEFANLLHREADYLAAKGVGNAWMFREAAHRINIKNPNEDHTVSMLMEILTASLCGEDLGEPITLGRGHELALAEAIDRLRES